uniref:Uncharacterized protein n=1 Tax=Aegilops tauschii subsp. strangulata TaxID=200361 RepID=A0A453IK90_AEGTS
MRSFFWDGKDKVNGGQCLVAWDTICRPKCYGGLGIKNLNWQALALRVRWEWLKRTEPNSPWQGLHMIEDRDTRELFDSLVHIDVGVGDGLLFWRDRWIHGFIVTDIAPLLQDTIHAQVANRWTVQQALINDRLREDCQVASFMAQMQLVHLCHAITIVDINQEQHDEFTWTCTPSGQYSASGIYASLCSGLPRSPMGARVWRSWGAAQVQDLRLAGDAV